MFGNFFILGVCVLGARGTMRMTVSIIVARSVFCLRAISQILLHSSACAHNCDTFLLVVLENIYFLC